MLDTLTGDAQGERWHILDAGTVLIQEFASAFSALYPSIVWVPRMQYLRLGHTAPRVDAIANPPTTVHRFALQRGYARPLVRTLLPFEDDLLRTMLAECDDPRCAPVIISTPHYAPLAEKWPGPVIYHSTDLTSAYEHEDPREITALDARMCRVARLVCPNSQRIADYFTAKAGCDPAKIAIIPNATRETNIAPAPLLQPAELPPDIRHIPRPIAGVLGNLANNMDWPLLEDAIERTPQLRWVFVGPTSMAIPDRVQSEARARVMQRAHFVGGKPYGELQAYAQSFDLAVLPYLKGEPQYSGSSTRFFQHLAACRPMISTRGFAMLVEKPPLLTLVDTAEELADAVRVLETQGFQDGYETKRWEESKRNTWTERSRAMVAAFRQISP